MSTLPLRATKKIFDAPVLRSPCIEVGTPSNAVQDRRASVSHYEQASTEDSEETLVKLNSVH